MKVLKMLLFSLVLFAFLIIMINSVEATEYVSDYYSTSEQDVSFSAGEFSFYSVNYRNFSSENSFGLTGIVINTNNIPMNFKATAYFYDYNKELIGTTESNQYVPANEQNSYSHMKNTSSLNANRSVNEIGYYKIKIETNPSNLLNNNINNTKTYGNGEYALTKYNIDVKVNENNTFNIVENITAYFNINKHGIFRKIPLRNEVTRLDGTKSNNRVKISDIRVNEQSSVYYESGYSVIKIGDPNSTFKGSKDYTINYLYNIGKDTGKGYDEFYFNLIGNEWDTTISGITFTITMPKEFDKSKLGFSSGTKGSTNSNNISYSVNGNVITGYYNGTLSIGEGLTIRLELPEEYFTGASNNFDFMMLVTIFVPIIFAIICFLLWKKYGKDDVVVETVEFYPPEGFNSAEVGFLYKGQVEDKDVISLLIYLANKGYIKILETEGKSLFSKIKGFKIVKLKEYDGDNINEKLFLKGLFKGKISVDPSFSSFKEMISIMENPEVYAEKIANTPIIEKEEVTLTDLQYNFPPTLENIKNNINNKKNKEKIFEKTSLGKGFIVVIMVLITFLLITVKPLIEYGEPGMLMFSLIFPGFGFTIMLAALVGVIKVPKFFAILWGSVFGGMPWVFTTLPALLVEPIYLFNYISGIICVAIMLFLLKVMPKRTPYGKEMLGKLKGFKNFLETAEKENLEAMVMQEPEYFYNILPYTYVLGVSDKWIEKFETISMSSPAWYDSPNTFDIVAFGGFMNTTMRSATNAVSSSPSSSSGGSGGGSSGGGSGGGGGGSW